MSEAPNDGGPAFPSDLMLTKGVVAKKPYSGMSLRDWFAGQALTGLLAHPSCKPIGPGFEQTTGYIAREAYAAADAMIAARAAK